MKERTTPFDAFRATSESHFDRFFWKLYEELEDEKLDELSTALATECEVICEDETYFDGAIFAQETMV